MPSAVGGPAAAVESLENDELEDDAEVNETADVVTTGTEEIDQLDSDADVPAPEPPAAPELVTPQLSTADPAAREEAAPELPAADLAVERHEPEER
jgi:hypothetical protein